MTDINRVLEKVSKDQENQALMLEHVPEVKDHFLTTRGYNAKGETIRKNVFDWRVKEGLEPNSVELSTIDVVAEMQQAGFKACFDFNNALQLRRWMRQKRYQAERQQED